MHLVIQQGHPDNFDTIINRFLADYRATKQCTTKEAPYKLMFNREMRTRFNILKPPTVKENIIESQQKAEKNFKGHRDVQFKIDEIVIIRDYSDPNNPSWKKAIITEIIGTRSYLCKFVHNGRVIKRHLDQIRGIVDREANAQVVDEHVILSESGASVPKHDAAAPMDATALVDETQSDGASQAKSRKQTKHIPHRMELRSRKKKQRMI